MGSKIAVLGGNGYLGAHVADHFGADRLSLSSGFDITNPSDVARLHDYDVVIHLAAKVDKSGEEDFEVRRVNVGGTRNVASVLRSDQTLVFASTKEVYTPGHLQDSYGASKKEAEAEIQRLQSERGFRSGIFRMATTYAPAENGTFVNYFVGAVERGEEVTLKMNGEQVRDFLYVDDLSRAFERFIGSDIQEGVWDIGGGKDNAYTFKEFFDIAGEVIGKDPVIALSPEDVPANQRSHVTNLEAIARDLGWSPCVSLREGIGRLISS